MEEALQHETTTQRIGLPPTGPGNHRPDGPEAADALTFKSDHSGGADHAQDQSDWIESLLTTLIIQKCGERANPAIRAKARALVSLAYGATLMRKSGMDKAEAGMLLKTREALFD